jgi:hypothetical protein
MTLDITLDALAPWLQGMSPDAIREVIAIAKITRREGIVLGLRCDIEWLVSELVREVACPVCDAPAGAACLFVVGEHRSRLRVAARWPGGEP